MILFWIFKSVSPPPSFPCSRIIESMALRARGWTSLLCVFHALHTLALSCIIRLRVSLAGLGQGCQSDRSLGKAEQEAARPASLTASPVFLSVRVWFSFCQKLELESENPGYLWTVSLAVVIACLGCPFSTLACHSQVDQRTFYSVESPVIKRKEL